MFGGLKILMGVLLSLAPLGAWAGDLTLEEDATPLVKVLSRPINVYHWVARERAGLTVQGLVDPHSRKVLTYTKNQVDLFWQTQLPQAGTLGNGLYVSTDPIAT